LLVSLVYLLFGRALAVAVLRLRSGEFKELEIVVLRHELAVLRRQVARPRLEDGDRVFLAAASRLLRGAGRQSFFVRPDTLLGWHPQLVRRRWTYAGRRPGRPAISESIGELVLRVARENPHWGYQRIVGELAGVGVNVAATTVRRILQQAGFSPADKRAGLCWGEFLRANGQSMIACDFFTVETLWLGRLYSSLRQPGLGRLQAGFVGDNGYTLDEPEEKRLRESGSEGEQSGTCPVSGLATAHVQCAAFHEQKHDEARCRSHQGLHPNGGPEGAEIVEVA
jgi:Homeodomain-like domain